MVYVLLKSELESFDRVRSLALKLSGDREKTEKGNGTDAKQIKQCISVLADFQEKTVHTRSGRNGKILVY